jgi:predicted dehydrogenase
MTRRGFVQSSVVGLTALSAGRVLGANERINVGLIGFGLIGRFHLASLKEQPDARVAAVCDVHQGRVEAAAAMAGGDVVRYDDFRKLLDSRDVDAVVVATPDHWHALMTMLACAAGKDVYVEKPLTLFVREGRWMLDVARRTRRVVQVGTQNRSGPPFQKARELIRQGRLGRPVCASINNSRNVMPGFGNPPDGAPPPELNYDLFLGPAPKRPYNPNRVIYHFRWFWDYSGGQMTNWGAHNLDIARWAMNVRAPLSVAAFGGRYALEDGGETPDVQEVIYNFPGFVLVWSVREMNSAGKAGFEFHGTKGNLSISRSGFKVTAEHWEETDEKSFKKKPNSKKAMVAEISDPGSEQPVAHVRNFLDCVKSRQRPNADVEEGHLTAVMCHLGNIATRLGRSLRWDAEKEQIIGDPEANRWLEKEYRRPWQLPKIS